jgi:hypothetical protein
MAQSPIPLNNVAAYRLSADYPSLSALMAKHPDMTIVRKFADLNLRNILYLQAELSHLEADLEAIVEEDRTSDDPARQAYGPCWYKLSSGSLTHGYNFQWQNVLKVREKLSEYSESDRTRVSNGTETIN